MSDLQNEIAALRGEVAELRAALEAIRSADQPSATEPWQQLSQHLKQHLAGSGDAAAVGVTRQVVWQHGQDGCMASSNRSVWTSGGDLSSHTENLLEMLNFWAGNPLAVRALSRLVECLLRGQPGPMPGQPKMLPKAELAMALGVDEPALEAALLPFVENETLRWTKRASGEECYEFTRIEASDTFLTLLALAPGP